MALRTLSFSLAALALSACNGGADCPVGQVDIAGTCCVDADADGACDQVSTCEAPFVDDGSGVCVCPTGTTDDGLGDCCTDSDADGECDPTYASPAGIFTAYGFGWDASNSTLRAFDATSSGTATTQNPYVYIALLTGDLDTICSVYMEIDATTPLTNVTSFTQPDNSTVSAAMGLQFAAGDTNVTIVDGDQIGDPACAGTLDPAVFGEDLVADIVAGNQTFSVTVSDPITSSHPLYTLLSGGISDWAANWEGKTRSGGTGFGAAGFLATSDGTDIAYVRSLAVDGNFDAGDLASPTYLAAGDFATTNGAIQGATVALTGIDGATLNALLTGEGL